MIVVSTSASRGRREDCWPSLRTWMAYWPALEEPPQIRIRFDLVSAGRLSGSPDASRISSRPRSAVSAWKAVTRLGGTEMTAAGSRFAGN